MAMANSLSFKDYILTYLEEMFNFELKSKISRNHLVGQWLSSFSNLTNQMAETVLILKLKDLVSGPIHMYLDRKPVCTFDPAKEVGFVVINPLLLRGNNCLWKLNGLLFKDNCPLISQYFFHTSILSAQQSTNSFVSVFKSFMKSAYK